MRDEQCQIRIDDRPMLWAALPEDVPLLDYPAACHVVLEGVDARAGGASTRRVFRGRLVNHGQAAAAVTLEITLPAPFLPSAPVLMQRLFTIAPGEALRVELGSTVGSAPSPDDVREAVRLRVA